MTSSRLYNLFSAAVRRAFRPSVSNACAYSLFVHGSFFAATAWGWLPLSHPFFFESQRKTSTVATVEVSTSAATPSPPIDVVPEAPIDEQWNRRVATSDENEIFERLPPSLSRRQFDDSPVLENTRLNKTERHSFFTDVKVPHDSRKETDFSRQPIVSPRHIVSELPVRSETTHVPEPVVELKPAVAASQADRLASDRDDTPVDFSGNLPPRYPSIAIVNRWEGTVLLRVAVSETGRVSAVEIHRSSGHAALDRAAVSAVSSWRGRPATTGGRPRATTEILPVQFRL